MLQAGSIGTPLLKPNATLDQSVAPIVASSGELADGTGKSKGWLTLRMGAFLSKMKWFYDKVNDVDTSDMDLCEWQNQTIMHIPNGDPKSPCYFRSCARDSVHTAPGKTHAGAGKKQ